MTEITTDDTVVRKTTAATAEIDGQLVALDAATGACYGLNRVATRIWALLETPTTPQSVVEALMAEYEVEASVCQPQTLDLLNDLAREGLIDVSR